MLVRTFATLLVLAIGGFATALVANGKDRGRHHTREPDANWVLLATRSIDLKKEDDRIEIGANKGRFTSLMVVGVDRRIDIYRVTIATDGDPYIDAERLKLEHGRRSQPIKFSHEGRVIEQVDLSYRLDLGAGGPAKVEVWGLRASEEAIDAQGGERWVWIGTRSVDLKKETDRIEVGANKGRFKSVRLVGLDRVIDIDRVTVVTDGAPHVEKQRLRLERGQSSRPMALGREAQVVRHVDLAYRLHLGAAGPANIELWGLRAASAVPVAVSAPPATTGAAATGAAATGPATATAHPLAETTRDGRGPALFGVVEVSQGVEQDVFKLGREYGQLSKLRLRARGGGVPLKEVRVIYAEGEPEVVPLDAELAADAQTDWLDLNGDGFIREIQFVYPRAARGGKTRLEVFGEYAESWFQPGAGTGGFSSANNGWLYLGGQSPLFVSIRRGLGYETDVVPVARNQGFGSLRVDVKNRAITLNWVKVVYDDGTSDVFAERQRVAGGSSFGPVELQSGRPVKEIEVSHRSRLFDSQAAGGGYAFVEFWVK
ncbi:MAG TPA: hypothetical protein VKF35_00995 [Hyphomicrobiaceae bacterium]|nr:hypothetical protein [Hyphomicrobiaceae bacterium]